MLLLLMHLFLLSGIHPGPLLKVELQSAGNPGARWGHVFVYDPVRDQVLLFGGARDRGAYLADTWTWDGEGWQSHKVPGPPARGFAAATFHPARGTVILHGGRGQDSQTYGDTWEWTGSAWRQIEEEGPYQADHHQMVYSAHDSLILAFGGWNGQGVTDETWYWDERWNQVRVQGPPGRAAFAMAYDTHREKVILFGGLWIDGQYADLWEWHDRSWHRQGGPYDNSSLDHHAMTYDFRNQQLIIFGGKNYRYVPLNKTRAVTGNTVQLLSNDGPTPRHSLGLTYDSRRGQVILYGGKAYQAELQIPLRDLWSWDGNGWMHLNAEEHK